MIYIFSNIPTKSKIEDYKFDNPIFIHINKAVVFNNNIDYFKNYTNYYVSFNMSIYKKHIKEKDVPMFKEILHQKFNNFYNYIDHKKDNDCYNAWLSKR